MITCQSIQPFSPSVPRAVNPWVWAPRYQLQLNKRRFATSALILLVIPTRLPYDDEARCFRQHIPRLFALGTSLPRASAAVFALFSLSYRFPFSGIQNEPLARCGGLMWKVLWSYSSALYRQLKAPIRDAGVTC